MEEKLRGQQANSVPVQEAGSPQREQNRKALLIMIGTAIVVAALIFGTYILKDEHHKQFATGEPYNITGQIVQADKNSRYNAGTHRTHNSYEITLEMDEELPNGSTTYTSSEGSEYNLLSPYADAGGKYVFTIDKKGYLIEVEPAEEQEPDNEISVADIAADAMK